MAAETKQKQTAAKPADQDQKQRTQNPKTPKPQNRRDKKFTDKGNRKQGRQTDVDGAPFKKVNKLDKTNSTKEKRQGEEAADVDAKLSRENPVDYYTKYDTFVSDAANLPFAKPLGTSNEHQITTEDRQFINGSSFTPGVMSLEFIPTIGVSNDFTSPINRSSIRFYTYLRSNQKASATYDHQDVTMMEVALDSCYMFHGLMSKIYAIENQFTPVNEYYSRATVAACYADFDDIRANMQDFRAYINAFAYSLGQYALPSNVTLFDRHRWMVEGLYTDSTSTRAQTYLFVPAGFWIYDNTVTTGSQLTWQQYANITHTFAQLKAIGDALLNAISNEEDFAIISGDIYNFYGGDTYKLPYIDENYTVLPVYNEVVLSQIENANILPIATASLLISQNPSVNGGAVIFQPYMSKIATVNLKSTMNFHHDSPSAPDVIEATRLMSGTDGLTNADGNYPVTFCGTEIVNAVKVWGRSTSSGDFNIVQAVQNNIIVSNSTTDIQTARTALAWAQFDWAPQLEYWYLNGDASTGSFTYQGSTWDVDNYDIVARGYLKNIHLGCLLSLFKVGTNRED